MAGDRITFGERIQQLEREFRARGRTQKDLAESLGVHPSTVRRWKDVDRPAPRTSNPGRAAQLSKELTDRFPGLDYQKLRRRERWYFREAPQVTKPTGDPPPSRGEPTVQRASEESGELARPFFAYQPDQGIDDNPDLLEAIHQGREVTIWVLAQSQSDPSEAVEVPWTIPGDAIRGVSRSQTRENLKSVIYRAARNVEAKLSRETGDTYGSIQITRFTTGA